MTDENPYPDPDPPFCYPEDIPLEQDTPLLVEAKKTTVLVPLRQAVRSSEHKLGNNNFLEADYEEESVVLRLRLIREYEKIITIEATPTENKSHHKYFLISRLRKEINKMTAWTGRFKVLARLSSIISDMK